MAAFYKTKPNQTNAQFRQPNDDCSVLVCTDIAARGLDILGVDHVFMFDFPLNAIYYLHRAGRTARGLNEAAKGQVSERSVGE